MNFEPGRFVFKENDPRFHQAWLTAPSLISLDESSTEKRVAPQWPLWTLRWLSLILLIKSITDLFSAVMPSINAHVIEKSASDTLIWRAMVALFLYDFGLFSLTASFVTLCGCGARSRGALTAVQVLVAIEMVLAIGRCAFCTYLVSQAGPDIVSSQDPTWLTLCHRFITVFFAMAVFGAVFVVARTAKIAMRSATSRQYTKLDDFR